MQFSNIYSLFRAQCDKYRERDVFYTRDGDGWKPQTWGEFEDKVHDLACALLAKGLTKRASVAILAGNVPEWTICDIAAIAAGGVGVGIYPTSSTEQCEFIVRHSDAEFLFVDTLKQYEKLRGTNGSASNLKQIICIEDGGLAAFLDFGRTNRERYLGAVESIGYTADAADTAIMVYTSGTTGNPKGAMLSHKYILNSVESLRRSVPIFDSDVSLSYLPGCHVAERISGIYNRLYNGAPAYFVDDLSRLYEYMIEVKPTVFASLPRFFEKIHAKTVATGGASTDDPQLLKDALGGRVRLLTSGGAPLPLEIADYFSRNGLPILQAYGLTENICVAFNTVSEHRFGTVGKPMPMCLVCLAGDGEILVKSEMMFSGYYKEPERSAEMFDANGWLKTGDLGSIDEDGFLRITGRKKEIIVLSTGKNIAPALVENYVKESHLISHCFLFGDGRSYCVALITLNEAELTAFARSNGIAAANISVLIRHETVQAAVDQTVAAANERVSRSEQIKKYTILEHDFSPAADEVTPTMKLKRSIVAANYKKILEKMYE
ncbi:MAG: long-chain fatty acid--CoA ligase [Pyrinomonadaceae bacterium]|nr:long-chain fatty acid--CoA ligase [Pyrinomonadaceae bacterium]MBP6213507.1 long-chain fatty acid--CoA ligase [Pyrinomonadaceae bacterium]